MILSQNLNGKSGVYCAIHRDSLKCYVGSSVDMGRRVGEHLKCSRSDYRTTNFHRALHNLGADSFDLEVLQFCPQAELVDRENFWIAFYRSWGLRGFNSVNKAGAGFTGRHHNAGTRERLVHAGKNRTDIEVMRAALAKGRAVYASQGWPGRSGRILSEDTKAKMRASAHKGKRFESEETKAKRRAARAAQVAMGLSDETRQKMRLAKLGKSLPEEHKMKIRASVQKALSGRIIPDAERVLRSETVKAAWQRRKERMLNGH